MRRVPWTLLSVAALLTMTACGDEDTAGTSAARTAAKGSVELSVVAAFYPLAWLAERVGREAVSVTNLTSAGTEPHDLEITSRQVERLEDADLAILMGRGFQPAAEKVAADRKGLTLFVLDELASGSKKVAREGHEGEEGQEEPGLDPHVWLDPVLMVELVDEVAGALSKVDAGRTGTYGANANELKQRLSALHGRFRSGLERCERRTIVTAHQAFGYLARRYRLSQAGIAGISPDAEPDPERLAELANLVKREGITTIFTEALVSPRVAQTLAREAGVSTDVLNPVEGLTLEELGRGKDYIGVMEDDLARVRKALGCRSAAVAPASSRVSSQ